MIAVVQRVLHACVTVDGNTVGRIGAGLLVLLGVERGDTDADLDYIVRKTANLRIFTQDNKMTLSVKDIGGEVLVVSQFTLLGDARKGNRPDFTAAGEPDEAERLYEACISALGQQGIRVQSGEFGAHMNVELSNDGPVTILLNSKRVF